MNVLMIAIDTLRADHLGCYGYPRQTSPNMDAFAQNAVVFERMIASGIPTHPSFVTTLTGQHPISHGVVAHGGDSPIPRSVPWLPALFQKNGYTTCAVDNLGDWRFGFARGFEFYIDPTRKRALSINCDNREINSRAIPWLERYGRERFFMMVHFWDTHTPYLPPRAYRTLFYKGDPHDPENHSLDALAAHPLGRAWTETWFNSLGGPVTDATYLEALYDAEIRYCDEGIKKLLATLDELGIADNTLVILMSDHGELMYRHGIFFDHHGLYDGNLHVPLIVRHPSFKPARVPHLVSHTDIAPTILDLSGLEIPEAMDGISLAPYLRGERTEPVRDFVVSEECTWQMKWSLRNDTHKFILAREEDFYHTPMRELYDLRSDPNELSNIAEKDTTTATAMERVLEDWIAEHMKQKGLTVDPLVANGITLGKAWKEGAPL